MWAFVGILSTVPALAGADETSSVGVGLDLYDEASSLNGRQTTGVAEANESFDYGAGPFALRSWMWLPWTERTRWGFGGAWRGRYAARMEDDDDRFVFGQLIELYGQTDYTLPLYRRSALALSGRAGLAVLFPEGDFDQEIDRLQGGDVGVWGGPRPGWFVGATAGIRYPATERITLVTDIAVEVERLYLFSTQDTVGTVHVDKSWTAEVTRYGLALGVEVTL